MDTWALTPAASPDKSDEPSLQENDSRRKRRKVRFASSTTEESVDVSRLGHFVANIKKTPTPELSPSSSAGIETGAASTTEDLSKCDHICAELERRTTGVPDVTPQGCSSPCLGHIDYRQDFRHQFYVPLVDGNDIYPYTRGRIHPEELLSMDDILGQSIDRMLTVPHQLGLAHRIVSAVLKFNATPWLGESWGARDLALFHRNQSQDLSRSLQTLHFGVDFVHRSAVNHQLSCSGSAMELDSHREEEEDMASSVDEATRRYGIRNVTLYILVVVLLAIGRWARVDAGEVEEVRRMAAEPCPLGSRYRELTLKVLDCDFGYGKDLKKSRLQEAVYEDVLLELESMVEKLDLGDDSHYEPAHRLV